MYMDSRWRSLFRDTALLTGSSLLLRFFSMAFQVWLVGRIGEAGIGLFGLIGSVNILCVTFAVSGIRFTTTRLVSEELGSGHGSLASAVLLRCLGYALFFGTAAFAVLRLFAEPIGFLWIGDARTVKSLRIVALRMPFISVSSVLNGFFIASGKAYRSAAIQVAEQLCGIALTVLLLGRAVPGDIEGSCAAVCLGGTLADIFSCALCAAACFSGRKEKPRASKRGTRLVSRMLRIAVPLAFSAYARTGLSTLENLLVPRKLRASGLSGSEALSGYGIITGMVLPLICFPACILSSVAELVIPQLTSAQVSGDTRFIRRTVSALMRSSLVFSLSVSAFAFLSADALGFYIYGSTGVGRYIRIFSLLIPFIYTDIVTDGCLKGLGQMMRSMCYNIAEALIGVFLVITVLPRKALDGYIFVLFACEIFNFTLSLMRLKKVAGFSVFPDKKASSGIGYTATRQ